MWSLKNMIEFITGMLKPKKQKCTNGPDCGWNFKPAHCDIFYNCKFNEVSMKPSQTQQLKLNQLEAEMMTIEMNKAALEVKIQVTRESIIHERKCEEKELSAAEKYAKECPTSCHLMVGGYHVYYDSDIKRAHAAGQKHGAGVERERFEPLIGYIERLIDDWEKTRSVTFGARINDLSLILKNLESDTEPEHGGLSEKPSWAEPETIKPVPIVTSINYQMSAISNKEVSQTVTVHIPNWDRTFKIGHPCTITPIKD